MNKQKEFNNLSNFYHYITTTETNQIFKTKNQLSSKIGTYSFTETNSFEEAIKLFKYGWSSKAKELEQALQIKIKNKATVTKMRNEYSVVGGQASVPRYLQGIPTNMINRKPQKQVQKVINLVKDVSYAGGVETDDMFRYSLTALQLIKAIEESGTRVNLSIVLGTKSSGESVQVKIKIKSANERLNISKLAFPLIHPSMIRRLLFRFIEVSDLITKQSFISGYGSTISPEDIVLANNEILIPKFFNEHEIESFIKNNLN